MPDQLKNTGEGRLEGADLNVVDFGTKAGDGEKKVKVGTLKTRYDDVGDIRADSIIQIVDTDGKRIEGATASFKRVTVPDLITEVNIEKDLLVGEKGTNDDVEASQNQNEIQKQIDKELFEGLIVELFREYNNKTGGEILRALKTNFIESKMGNPVTLPSENTYIIARTGAETMKKYLMGIPRTLADGKVVNSSLVIDKKLEGRDLGFSAILECGKTKFKIDFIFGDEETETAPAKTEDQKLSVAA